MPVSAYAQLPFCESEIYLYLSQVIREQAHSLYAFIERQERDLFETLLGSSGIGPKIALGILGHVSVTGFYQAIGSADLKFLSKLPGIGKKTAERLILEMRDKGPVGMNESKLTSSEANNNRGLFTDAVRALLNLGYTQIAAERAVQSVKQGKPDGIGLSQVITDALSIISSF